MRYTSLRVAFASAALAAAALCACSSDTSAPGGGSAGNAGQTTSGTGGVAGSVAGGGATTTNPGGATNAGAAGQGGVTLAGAAGSASGGAGGAGGSAGTATGGASCEPGPLALSSSAFVEAGPIAEKYRCTGDNITPPLAWTCGPEGTKSYAVTQIHGGSQTLHWVLFDIAVGTSSLPEGIAREAMPPVPAGSKQVKPNVDGSTWYGYSGPCPGGANQSYTYFVYALDVATLPGVTSESSAIQADAAVKQHMLAVAQLTGTASKP